MFVIPIFFDRLVLHSLKVEHKPVNQDHRRSKEIEVCRAQGDVVASIIYGLVKSYTNLLASCTKGRFGWIRQELCGVYMLMSCE